MPCLEHFVLILVFVVVFLDRGVIHFDALLQDQEHRLGKEILALERHFILHFESWSSLRFSASCESTFT